MNVKMKKDKKKNKITSSSDTSSSKSIESEAPDEKLLQWKSVNKVTKKSKVTNRHNFALILNFIPVKTVLAYKDICMMLLYTDGFGRKFYLDCILNEQGGYDFFKDHHKWETRTVSIVPRED